MIISPHVCSKRFRQLRGMGKLLRKAFPRLEDELKTVSPETGADDFMVAALLSSVLIGAIFSALVFLLSKSVENPLEKTVLVTIGTFFAAIMVCFLIFTKYPGIISKKKAQEIDKHLMFALKDMLLHTSSGASIYNALVSIANAGYGEVSEEFHNVAKDINSGTSADTAFERLAQRTESEYMKKVLWQIINTIRSGGNLKESLGTIVHELVSTQRANIVGYANELNLWSLVYMIFAVAAPTIGVTMMIILSSFADIGINKTSMAFFVGLTMVIQIVIITLIKARRPVVEF